MEMESESESASESESESERSELLDGEIFPMEDLTMSYSSYHSIEESMNQYYCQLCYNQNLRQHELQYFFYVKATIRRRRLQQLLQPRVLHAPPPPAGTVAEYSDDQSLNPEVLILPSDLSPSSTSTTAFLERCDHSFLTPWSTFDFDDKPEDNGRDHAQGQNCSGCSDGVNGVVCSASGNNTAGVNMVFDQGSFFSYDISDKEAFAKSFSGIKLHEESSLARTACNVAILDEANSSSDNKLDDVILPEEL
ncbi:hypothetical protein Dimus_000123 [Dionaea muscipula]